MVQLYTGVQEHYSFRFFKTFENINDFLYNADPEELKL